MIAMLPHERTYLNFDLRIDRDPTSGEFSVAVVASPAGETSTPLPLRLPFAAAGLENRLLKLQLALRQAGLVRKSVLSPEEQAVREFGAELFGAAFNDDVLALYRASRERARVQQSGLRVRLRVSPPELATLPWEFLYDSGSGDFLCLSTQTPLVRYLDIPHSPEPLQIAPPLRILGMVADPNDLPRLDVEGEIARIEAALAPLVQRGQVTLEWLKPPTAAALQAAMGQGQVHILHFIGHGGFDRTSGEGLISLVHGQTGAKQPVPATILARILDENPQLRLVFLNACEGARADDRDIFSSTAATLVRRGIPAVLAMQYEITDHAAKLLAQIFYEAIATGQPVDAAISRARVAITAEEPNSLEWGTPVLTMRSPDGLLFHVDRGTETSAQQATAADPAAAAQTESLVQQPAPAAAGPDHSAWYKQARMFYDTERYEEALPLLENLLAAGYGTDTVTPLIKVCKNQIELKRQKAADDLRQQQERVWQEADERRMKEQYNQIVDLALRAKSEETLLKADADLGQFMRQFPHYGDPANVRRLLQPRGLPRPDDSRGRMLLLMLVAVVVVGVVIVLALAIRAGGDAAVSEDQDTGTTRLQLESDVGSVVEGTAAANDQFIARIFFTVTLAPGAEPVDLSRPNAGETGPVVSYSDEAQEITELPWWLNKLGEHDDDNLLESGERAEIWVRLNDDTPGSNNHLTTNLGPNTEFRMQFVLGTEVLAQFERQTPASLDYPSIILDR